jgi:acetyltransferase-like isoleucine patch superfamily enzyme
MSAILQNLITQLKIKFKVNVIYEIKFKDIASVKSILSDVVEKKILTGTIIERKVRINDTINHIGEQVFIGENTIITNCKCIGAFSSISKNVMIGLDDHPQTFISTSPAFYSKRRRIANNCPTYTNHREMCEIGADVLISSNVLVMKGVRLGVGCIIGAGSVVTKDIPPYAIAVGTPAKVIRYRFDDEMITKLIESNWWENSSETLSKVAQYADNPQLFLQELSKLTQ